MVLGPKADIKFRSGNFSILTSLHAIELKLILVSKGCIKVREIYIVLLSCHSYLDGQKTIHEEAT